MYLELFSLFLYTPWELQNVTNSGRLDWNWHATIFKLISGEHIGALAMSEPNCECLHSSPIPFLSLQNIY